jgi:hypothetical protein
MAAAALAAALTALSGCGSSDSVRVGGSLVKGGTPLKVEEGQWVQLMLLPENAASSGEWFPANINPDGTFDVPGKEGQGIPRGKYRVSVKLVTYKDRNHDLLKGVFGRETSPVVVEIDSSKNLTVDLAAADSAPEPKAEPVPKKAARKRFETSGD